MESQCCQRLGLLGFPFLFTTERGAVLINSMLFLLISTNYQILLLKYENKIELMQATVVFFSSSFETHKPTAGNDTTPNILLI